MRKKSNEQLQTYIFLRIGDMQTQCYVHSGKLK